MEIKRMKLADIKLAHYNPSQYRILKNCLICDKQFLAKKDCKTRNQLYCSKECYGKSQIGKKLTSKQLLSLELGRRGHPSLFKGIKRNDKTRQKISEAKKGKNLSSDHKLALSNAKKGKPIKHFLENREDINAKLSKALRGKPQLKIRGENHWNWQNGKTEEQARIRNSLEMIKWRRAVFERDDYTCQLCFIRGGRLVADHIKPFCLFPELRFELDNGRTLCKDCDREYSDTYGGRAVKNYADILG